MKVGTGLGIAALVFCIVGAFMPLIGLYIGWLALIIATIAAFLGERGLTITTMIISALAFIFLTPSLWMGFAVSGIQESAATDMANAAAGSLVFTAILLFLPIVGMVFGIKPAKTEK